MKNTILLLIFFLMSLHATAQLKSCAWATMAQPVQYHASHIISSTTDKYGNTYIAGDYVADTMYFGSFYLVNTFAYGPYTKHYFIAKYDANGNALWAKNAGENGVDSVAGITADNFGNSYLIGSYSSDTIIFDNYILTNYSFKIKLFIVKYDSSGNVAWVKTNGGNAFAFGSSIYADDYANIYVGGVFGGSGITLDTITLAGTGHHDVFIAQYTNTGNAIWVRRSNSSNISDCRSIVKDLFGNVLVAGNFNGNISFGNDSLNGNGNWNIFLTKYDLGGNVVWAKGTSGIGDSYVSKISTDYGGNIFMTGWFQGPTLIFENDTLINASPAFITNDAFIVRYNTAGNIVWAKSAGGNNDDYIRGMQADENGNTYLIGDFKSDSITFGNFTLINDNISYFMPKILIIKNDILGNTLWMYSPGGVNNNLSGNSIGIDSAFNVYASGGFKSLITFCADSLTTTSGTAIFVVRLDSTVAASIHEDGITSESVLYPNPATTILNFSLRDYATCFTFSVYSYTGTKVMEVKNKTTIDISGLASGLYFVEIFNGANYIQKKFIKE